jgi:16S rRNA G1207 methylase RsmC
LTAPREPKGPPVPGLRSEAVVAERRRKASGHEGPAASGKAPTNHYFAAQPTAAHRPGLVRVVLPDVYLELETDSGMFSPGRLDPGTRFLLEAAPAPAPAGDLLDLGCGYGPIACTIAARSPGATVWAVDVNERALALCAANAARAGLSNVRCATPDDPGPIRRSGSASRRCIRCCCGGSAGSGPAPTRARRW